MEIIDFKRPILQDVEEGHTKDSVHEGNWPLANGSILHPVAALSMGEEMFNHN